VSEMRLSVALLLAVAVDVNGEAQMQMPVECTMSSKMYTMCMQLGGCCVSGTNCGMDCAKQKNLDAVAEKAESGKQAAHTSSWSDVAPEQKSKEDERILKLGGPVSRQWGPAHQGAVAYARRLHGPAVCRHEGPRDG
jgi:hypothetical protein